MTDEDPFAPPPAKEQFIQSVARAIVLELIEGLHDTSVRTLSRMAGEYRIDPDTEDFDNLTAQFRKEVDAIIDRETDQ